MKKEPNMKNLFLIVISSGIIAATLAVLPGCNKNAGSASSTRPSLELSKTTVARGEPLTVSVQNLSSSATVKWSVYPSSGSKLFSSQEQATAYFGNQGAYTLTANYYADSASSPFDSSSSPVIVSDSIYTPPLPQQSDTSALAGDQIQIEPITATDTGGLILVAQTVNLYSCNPRLNYNFTQQGNQIQLFCLSVSSNTAANCGSTMSTAKAFIFAQAPADGVYEFDVILNTATFRGTLTVTDQTYTFSWPYSSEVTLSPLQIATK